MGKVLAASDRAQKALELVTHLQQEFVQTLEELDEFQFHRVEWLRDDGVHGGGVRFQAFDTPLFGRASINTSQVHYDEDAERKLASASALSAIVHPAHPHMPSIHIHISWTEQKSGHGYWRIMADLNPAIPNPDHTAKFIEALKQAAPDVFEEAMEQGDQYFYIPALEQHRGIAHFYLENYNGADFDADLELAQRVGKASIEIYTQLLAEADQRVSAPTEEEQSAQLAYHTLYFFQVLTLDRGTTSGLLVHSQNDLGILGSLPPRIDKNQLSSWRSLVTPPQDRLLGGILSALPDTGSCWIEDGLKRKLASVIRAFYQTHPQALDLQASGNSTPPTINNHK